MGRAPLRGARPSLCRQHCAARATGLALPQV